MTMGYYAPTNVHFGAGAEDKVAEVLKAEGATKVLIHFGGGSVKRSGLLDKVEKAGSNTLSSAASFLIRE